jgi:hypothetical protein
MIFEVNKIHLIWLIGLMINVFTFLITLGSWIKHVLDFNYPKLQILYLFIISMRNILFKKSNNIIKQLFHFFDF